MADASITGDEHMETVRRAVLSNLTKSYVALMHPGGIKLNETIYSSSENSVLDASIYQLRSGIARIPASSLSLMANMNFTINNTSVISGLYLTGQITIPEGAVLPSLWFYYGLQNVQIGMPGISNFQLNGISLLNLFLRQNPEDRRNELSNLCPGAVGVTGGTTVKFTVPLSYIIGEGFVADRGFYQDQETLNSVMQFSFLFNPPSQWIGGLTGGIVGSLPTQFDALNMKVCSQIDILNSEFSMAKNSDIFRIPFTYVTSYPLFQQRNAGPGQIQQLSLQALPTAELCGILIFPVASNGRGSSSNNQAAVYDPIQLTYHKLSLQGQDLILLEQNAEILTQNQFFSVGSSAGFYYDVIEPPYTNSATGSTGTYIYTDSTPIVQRQRFTSLECFIADPSGTFAGKGKFQLARNFSGQIFTFYYQVPDDCTVSRVPYIDWYITYLANGLINIENGAAKLVT